MPAGILRYDKVVATEPTWHRMEELKRVITFEESGLDWEVLSRPVYSEGNRLTDAGPVIPGYQEIFSMGPGAEHIHLALMKKRYTAIQPKAVWEFMEKALDGVACVVTCAGSLEDRKKIFISVRLTGKGKESFYVNGDKYFANLNFLSSNDGSTELEVFDSGIRVVCLNTFNFSRALMCQSKIRGKARHTKNNAIKIEKIAGQVNTILESRKVFVEHCEGMAKHAVTKDEAYTWAVGWGFPSHREKPSAQVLANAEAIADAFERGDGNNGKTRYDLFNGVTQHFTRNTTRSDSNVYQSSFVGLGATRKGEAFDIIASPERYKYVLAAGKKAVALLS